MQWPVVALGIAAVAGCGRLGFDGLSVPSDAAPEIRLTQASYEAGGVQVPNGLFDTSLDAKCSFGKINGDVRCVPSGMTVVYSDSACTSEVAAKQSCKVDTRYVVRGDIALKGEPTHVFHAGASRGVTPTYIHNGDPSSCTSWATVETFDIGDEIATDSLPAGTIETTPGMRLDTVDYVSAEGLRQLAHFVDHDLGFDCDIGVAHVGYQCAPGDALAFASYSSTSACSDHVAVSASVPSAIAWENYATGCSLTDFYYYSVGGPITPSVLYQGASCSQVTPLPAGPFYVSGSLLPVQTLSRAPDVVSGQRIAVERITGGGASVPNGLYDTQLGVDCGPATMSDGQVRCVPSGAYTSQMYTDSGCANLVTFATYLDFTGCAQDTFKYAVGGQNNGCTSALDVYEIGAAFTGQFWVKDQTGTCTGPYAASGEPRYWSLGRKLSSSELVEATLP